MASLSALSAPPLPTAGAAGAPPLRQAALDLGRALRTGDLDAARESYVAVVKAAPEGATWNPDGAFAGLGRALKAGDLEAARAAGQQIASELRAVLTPAIPGDPTVVPATQPAPSTTGGAAGTLLNVVA